MQPFLMVLYTMEHPSRHFYMYFLDIHTHPKASAYTKTYMLWFKFTLAFMFFGLVSISFAIVLYYGNECMTK